MFYSPAILAKKGDLSKIWLAAHWQHKLSKQQVFATDIAQSCQQIKQPSVPLSLRLSGQLLHGVARIHQKKVLYLYTDCSEALVKIKMAFRPGVVNLSLQETSSTPSRINAPNNNGGVDDDSSVIGAPSTRSTPGKNRFRDVEPKVDDDDWMKLTPVHTARRSITRRTPTTFDNNEDVKSVTTLEEKEDWSDFPFAADETSSIELVRKADVSKAGISSLPDESGATAAPEYDYQDYGNYGDANDFPPSSGDENQQQHNVSGNIEGLMLNSTLKKSWLDDALLREEEEEEKEEEGTMKTPKTKSKKKSQEDNDDDGEGGERKRRKGIIQKSASKRKKKVELVTEISSEEIQKGLTDTSDLTSDRKKPNEIVLEENELRNIRNFDIFPPFSQTTFELGLETPAMFGLHPRILKLFQENAKTVEMTTSSFGEDEGGGEDIEVARTKPEMEGEEREQQQEEEGGPRYEEVENFGDVSDYPNQDQSFASDTGGGGGGTASDELELTFRETDEEKEETSFSQPTTTTDDNDTEKWNPQTIKMMKILRQKLSKAPVLSYQDLAEGEKRSTVAKAFFEVLQLTTRSMIHVSQNEPYGEILISPGAKYENVLPGEIAS